MGAGTVAAMMLERSKYNVSNSIKEGCKINYQTSLELFQEISRNRKRRRLCTWWWFIKERVPLFFKLVEVFYNTGHAGFCFRQDLVCRADWDRDIKKGDVGDLDEVLMVQGSTGIRPVVAENLNGGGSAAVMVRVATGDST